MANDYRIGIDWGGTRIKLAAVTRDGEFLAQAMETALRGNAIGETVGAVISAAEALIERVGGKPRGIGLALTGPVDPEFGVVYLPGKVAGLEQYPIVPQFREHFGVPVTADNDGTMALLAERACGHAREVDWATVLTIGTGVGSGVLVAGQVLRDPHFMFGTQAGHLVIRNGDEPLCLTGARGTAEMHCSATALMLAVRSGLQRGIPSALTALYDAEPGSVDFRAVIEEGVANGDHLCCDELRRWSTQLGWLIVNVIHAYSSQVVILTGGATLGAAHFLPQVQSHVDAHVFRYPPDKPVPIKVSAIQEHAGTLGAAMASFERHPSY
ncbi:MAG: ROK family protein [Opitutales bacterium]